MKKLLFITWSMSHGYGTEKSLADILNRIDSTKYSIDVLPLFKNSESNILNSNINILDSLIDYTEENFDEKKALDNYYSILANPLQFNKLIKEKYDCVIACNHNAPSYFASYLKNTPKVVWIRGDMSELNYNNFNPTTVEYSGVKQEFTMQKNVLKNQFKKVYSTFSQGVFQAQNQLDMPIACSYWLNGGLCEEVCTEYDPVYNNCKTWQCKDGSPLSADHNGIREDCKVFEEELFNKVFKVVKFCEDNALANGCLTSEYRGTDKVKAEQNPNPENPYNPNSAFSDTNIKNNYSSWILADGTVIIKYGKYKDTSKSVPIYTVDINGHKKPNKWGYDIFTFQLKGDKGGIKKIDGLDYASEKGGKTTMQMIQDK